MLTVPLFSNFFVISTVRPAVYDAHYCVWKMVHFSMRNTVYLPTNTWVLFSCPFHTIIIDLRKKVDCNVIVWVLLKGCVMRVKKGYKLKNMTFLSSQSIFYFIFNNVSCKTGNKSVNSSFIWLSPTAEKWKMTTADQVPPLEFSDNFW